MIIVDTSAAGGWILEDEQTEITERFLGVVNEQGALMPLLWYYEIRNLVLMKERIGRLTSERTRAGLDLIDSLPIDFDHEPDDKLLLRVARRHHLTSYDAAYLELALREDLPLATFDKALATAAKNEGVTLLT
jgi:predicted nucleic acid-binding protein